MAAAVETTLAQGWSQVTMARLADAVGVSRQTVYNEIGGKPALAEAMVLAELDRFLGVVTEAFDDHPDDLVAAIEAATAGRAPARPGNDLLKAVVSATHGADTELLPLLTTHSESLLESAKLVVAERVRTVRRAARRAPRPRDRHGGAGGAEPRHAALRLPGGDGRRPGLDRLAGAARLSQAGCTAQVVVGEEAAQRHPLVEGVPVVGVVAAEEVVEEAVEPAAQQRRRWRTRRARRRPAR